jgi:hypothetical protein
LPLAKSFEIERVTAGRVNSGAGAAGTASKPPLASDTA